ncbi:hypothetical protein Tco_0841936 [Tanacetum coccineum]|uniref:Uncharacterized protein n=1 Tax=Tanacetum coccineum TaxID=301880 RepID=A0ABQ5AZN0_9ASTR
MPCSFDHRGMWDRRVSIGQILNANSGSTTLGRSKVLENKHHLNKLKTNAYFPSLPPYFKPAQPITKNTQEPLDPNEYDLCAPNSHHEDEEVSSDEDADECLNAEMGKRMTGTIEIQGVSFVTKAKEGDSSETLLCQLPPKEMNPRRFTLPCTIVEMADMIKKAPLGIVENFVRNRKEESGMLKQWICFRDHERQNVGGNGMIFADFLKVRYGNKNIDDDDLYSRRFNVYKEKFDSKIEQFANEYDLRVGMKKYSLEDIWEKCGRFQDTACQSHDEGFEEEEQWESDIEKTCYTPPFVKSETFEVKQYSFKNKKSFVRITKQLDDAQPLGRVNGSRFMGMIRKEIEEEGKTTRKT